MDAKTFHFSVNGHALGELWKSPYRIDVTSALKLGENKVEIKVTNEWTNRLAGDATVPEGQKILNTGPSAAGRGGRGGGGRGGFGGALPESGLLGPVTILSQSPVP